MKVKNTKQEDINLKYNIDTYKEIVTILTDKGLLNIPILTYGMSKDDGVFAIIDERYLEK